MTRDSEDVIFALIPENIEVDDVILTSDFGGFRFGIRTFTKSDFSHAALCTRPGMLFEAVIGGVLRRSAIGTYAPRAEWIKVLRPKTLLGANVQGKRVADYAESLYGRAYSWTAAIASKIPFFSTREDGGVFCSQIVAQAYLEYGMPLLPGTAPSRITPGMLLDSGELRDVTSSCIRKLGAASNTDTYQSVVQTADNDLPGNEMRMNRRVFEAIRDRLSDNLPSHVHSLLELWTWLSENFTAEAVKRADLVIVDVLEGEGFFKWYEEWGNQVRSDTAGLEVLARAVEQSAREPITAAIRSLLADLADADLLGETSVSGRLDTRVSYERLARNTGLEIFQRLSEKYNAEYADAEKLHYGRKRLIRALSLLTQA